MWITKKEVKKRKMKKKFVGILLAAILVMSVIALGAVAVAKPDKVPNGQAGKSNVAHLYLFEKDPSDWSIVEDGAWGKMKYNRAGPTFDFVFNGHGLDTGVSYSLIYYPEPQITWPWPITVIATGIADSDGNVHLADSYDFGQDLNGAKIWLVLNDDIVGGSMSGWNPTEYLFEYDLITFDDTDV